MSMDMIFMSELELKVASRSCSLLAIVHLNSSVQQSWGLCTGFGAISIIAISSMPILDNDSGCNKSTVVQCVYYHYYALLYVSVQLLY